MIWVKKGLILEPSNDIWWMVTHAMLPTAVHLQDDLFRIYYSGRDKENRSLIGYADVEISEGNIGHASISKDPVLTIGERGCFDDNGVTPSWIVKEKDRWLMYYIGWNSGNSTTRMGLIAGLAISTDEGESFARYSRAPLLQRTDAEPFGIMTAPCVLKNEELGIWQMWYVSCVGWQHRDLPMYNIKYAYSEDGINWVREPHTCIDFIDENETALARPSVLFEDGEYKMWFSYKDPKIGYRIGFANSNDGKNWNRQGAVEGIETGAAGEWDEDMVEYSNVFDHKGIRYMLYNGNGYGINGVGYAVLEP